MKAIGTQPLRVPNGVEHLAGLVLACLSASCIVLLREGNTRFLGFVYAMAMVSGPDGLNCERSDDQLFVSLAGEVAPQACPIRSAQHF
eukprot:2233689-Amphidinium_carterae.1